MGTIFADAADPHKLAQLRDTFRGRLSPFPWEADEVLARFLNARKGDANEAATMLEASLIWRQSHPSLLCAAARRGSAPAPSPAPSLTPLRPSRIPRSDFCYPEEADVRRAMPQGFHKVDRRGRPVQYQLLGRADAEQLMRATTLERLLEWNVHRAEHTIRVKYPRCAKVAGRPVGQSIVVIDLAGATMSQFSGEVRQYLQQYFQTLGNNFPGNLARVLVLNTPMFFQPVWSVVKRFLPPSDGERITLLGGPSQYEPVLRELIEPASLPRQYGGTDDSFDTSRDDGVWLDEQFAAASAAAMDSHAI